MKFYFALILFSAIIFAMPSCKKSDPSYMNNAEILGWEASLGACSGGYRINIDGVGSPIGYPFYFTVDSLPPTTWLSSTSTFPVLIKIDWHGNDKCSGIFVEITRIAKR